MFFVHSESFRRLGFDTIISSNDIFGGLSLQMQFVEPRVYCRHFRQKIDQCICNEISFELEFKENLIFFFYFYLFSYKFFFIFFIKKKNYGPSLKKGKDLKYLVYESLENALT